MSTFSTQEIGLSLGWQSAAEALLGVSGIVQAVLHCLQPPVDVFKVIYDWKDIGCVDPVQYPLDFYDFSHQSLPNLENYFFPRLTLWSLLRTFNLVFIETTHFFLSSSCFMVYIIFRSEDHKHDLCKQAGNKPYGPSDSRPACGSHQRGGPALHLHGRPLECLMDGMDNGQCVSQ